jgi:hypothetical protein
MVPGFLKAHLVYCKADIFYRGAQECNEKIIALHGYTVHDLLPVPGRTGYEMVVALRIPLGKVVLHAGAGSFLFTAMQQALQVIGCLAEYRTVLAFHDILEI